MPDELARINRAIDGHIEEYHQDYHPSHHIQHRGIEVIYSWLKRGITKLFDSVWLLIGVLIASGAMYIFAELQGVIIK